MRGSYVPETDREIDRFIDLLDEMPPRPDEIPGESVEAIARSLVRENAGRVQRSAIL